MSRRTGAGSPADPATVEPGWTELYNGANNRNEAQAERMRQLSESGTCLFCPPQIDLEPAEGLELATRHWVVRRNDFPYSGAALHLLVVPRQHVRDLVDLTDEALAEFWTVVREMRERHHLTFYGLAARCGDCRFTGGTIAHIHVHMIVGDVDDPGHQPVRVKLSSRPPAT